MTIKDLLKKFPCIVGLEIYMYTLPNESNKPILWSNITYSFKVLETREFDDGHDFEMPRIMQSVSFDQEGVINSILVVDNHLSSFNALDTGSGGYSYSLFEPQ